MPSYKSFCWSLGTTSFRMVEFNKKIERQLELLKNFWNQPQFQNQNWENNPHLQVSYYNFLKKNQFIEGNAARKDKDAREKTSGLVDLGLLDKNRRLTDIGQKLLEISLKGDFKSDNILQLPADSFIYFCQLLKLSYTFDGQTVRPFAVLAILLTELGEISSDIFTFLLPLITNEKQLQIILQAIKKESIDYDGVIYQILSSMENYQEALSLFLKQNVNENLILEIGMNRKSRDYDKPYFPIYQTLFAYKNSPNSKNATALWEAVSKISNSKTRNYWNQYFFKNPKKKTNLILNPCKIF